MSEQETQEQTDGETPAADAQPAEMRAADTQAPETQAAEAQEAEVQGPDTKGAGPTKAEDAPAPEQPVLPGTIPEPEERLALLEAIVYVAEDPVAAELIAENMGWPIETVEADLARLAAESAKPHRGIEVRKVAGGYKMFTKAEHHEAVRNFVKSIRAKLRLSLPALHTLAVIAYKQPVTGPEIQAIRGVQATGVLHTLLKHKLITTAGRKKVVGKPMMYKTTREFLMQFGLDDLTELPSLKEMEEISRAALGEEFAEEESAETDTPQSEGDRPEGEQSEREQPEGDSDAPPEVAEDSATGDVAAENAVDEEQSSDDDDAGEDEPGRESQA